MEYCNGGELFDKLTTNRDDFTEEKAREIMKSLFLAVNHCHSNGIAHRDLKPENIMYSNDGQQIKLIDFGLSKSTNKHKNLETIVGTPYYLAPEILNGQYGYECDCWSLGVIMYIVLSGYLPFPGQTQPEVFEKVKSGDVHFEYREFDAVSDNAKDLIKKMLTVNKKKRFTCAQALAHAWFAEKSDKLKT